MHRGSQVYHVSVALASCMVLSLFPLGTWSRDVHAARRSSDAIYVDLRSPRLHCRWTSIFFFFLLPLPRARGCTRRLPVFTYWMNTSLDGWR